MKPKLVIILVLAFLGIATYFVVRSLFGVALTSFTIPASETRGTTMMLNPSAAGSIAVSPKMMGDFGGDVYYPQPTAPIIYPYPNNNDTSLYNPNRVYLKNSAFSFVVTDTSKYVFDVSNYFLTIGGRILSSQINSTDKFTYAYLMAKIPVDKFDEVNMKVKDGVKKIISANTNSTDDTARLDSSSTQLDQLKADELNKQKDIAAEKDATRLAQLKLELKYIQDQIKAAQTQVKQVTAQTDYATVTLTVADSERYFRPISSDQPDLKETWDNSLASLVSILLLVAAFTIQVAVFSVLWLPVVLAGWFVAKKVNAKKQ